MEKNNKKEIIEGGIIDFREKNEIIVPIPEEAMIKKLSYNEIMNRLSPGKSLRIALDDILEGETGALIVVDCPEMENLVDGGFRINCRFTSQKLAELAKMDGAIILSSDLKKILFANVLLVPDTTIQTNETGTRHKAAERTAKQTGTAVIAVSERRNKITLFYEDKKHIIEDSENILRRATETLNILEKQREIFEELLKNFNILEITKLVSVADVCSLLQRIAVIIKMMDTMKKYLIELGNQGIIIRMRIREIFKGIEELEESLIKDYSSKPLYTRKILSSINFDGVLDTESLSRMLFEEAPETQVYAKGFRLLGKLNLNEKEMKTLIANFGNFQAILEASEEDLSKILKNKTFIFKKDIENLKEQILLGKKI